MNEPRIIRHRPFFLGRKGGYTHEPEYGIATHDSDRWRDLEPEAVDPADVAFLTTRARLRDAERIRDEIEGRAA